MTLVVKDVPAEICDMCGEPYFNEQVTQRLLDLAREAAAAGVVVFGVDPCRHRLSEVTSPHVGVHVGEPTCTIPYQTPLAA
jgi:hypothetical protein